MKKKLILIGLIIALAGSLIWYALPTGMPAGDLYFKDIGERELQQDEIGQFNYVYDQYLKLGITGDEFSEWDEDQQLLWRYGIAFSSYAMPSIVMISDEYGNTAKKAMKIMIEKMKSRKVWGDWIDYGMGDDPISEGNIMYKGHLNLMYGLFQLISGDTTFAREYTWMTERIVHELRRHHKEGKHEGADCEPGRYFAQCNSISLMSLKVYDKLYGTNYLNEEGSWTLDFIKDKMTDEESGLYKSMYNSDMEFSDPYLTGYTNAWTMSFLQSFDKDYNQDLYPTWKDKFVIDYGPYASVREDLGAGPSPLAHMTGLLAAKEFEDIELYTKLRNSMDRRLYKETEKDFRKYEGINNAIYNGPILWTKVHMGWDNILEYDWGHKVPYSIPDVSDMLWTDILDKNLMLKSEN
ncbi:MAG: hypothetical protein R8P61_34805 [Bacteroidia bacterium]|nr:hypothetical protein [Bacteroidia bacterium]